MRVPREYKVWGRRDRQSPNNYNNYISVGILSRSCGKELPLTSVLGENRGKFPIGGAVRACPCRESSFLKEVQGKGHSGQSVRIYALWEYVFYFLY